ncbi:MAG: hypothetical protein MJY99_09665 [Fibrobacter sp.]|uniref:hypothetical protein n=1 Tax=Fibrobacter sp. TaxID=35828 RepID=UPI0038904C05|nr:hypothetical protein [Fibrobacter sp.]
MKITKVLILLLAGLCFAGDGMFINYSFGGIFDKVRSSDGDHDRWEYDQITEEHVYKGTYESELRKINGKGGDVAFKIGSEITPYFSLYLSFDASVSFGTFKYKLHDFDKKWTRYDSGSTRHYMLGIGSSVMPFPDTSSILHGLFFNGAFAFGILNTWNGEESDKYGSDYHIAYSYGTVDMIAEVGKLWRIGQKFYLGGYFKYVLNLVPYPNYYSLGAGVTGSWKIFP